MFNDIVTDTVDITLELSCSKYPKPKDIPQEWISNKQSMMEYMKMVHVGIKGRVSDDSNQDAVKGAEIEVIDFGEKPIKSIDTGEYWRLLPPGVYKVKVVAKG